MIKNPHLLESLERNLVRQEAADHLQNLRVFEALYRQARSLGALPLRDPLDDIETDLRLARVLRARETV